VNYRQHLAAAMVALGEGDAAAAHAELDHALQEARAVDADGPREAEVHSMAAQFHRQAGQDAQAQEAERKAAAIWARFPEAGA
jgi:hypothetical protein